MKAPSYFADLTSPEAGEILKTADYCVLPWGSNEQHGGHLPLSTDSLIAAGFINHLVEHLSGRVSLAVLPPLVYGHSPEHAGFPGTLSLSMNTMTGLVRDICCSLARHGCKRLLIINAHGGNTAVLGACLREIREETGIMPFVFEIYGSETIGSRTAELDYHAGEVETSLMLYLYPEKVKRDKYPSGWKFSPAIAARARLNLPWKAEEFSSDGVIGVPGDARAQLGRELIMGLCDELAGLLTLSMD